MMGVRRFVLAALFAHCLASETTFSVNDDLFAFPQYSVEFADAYILEADAAAYLANDGTKLAGHAEVPSKLDHNTYGSDAGQDSRPSGTYERLLLEGYPHLCFIPEAKSGADNATKQEPSATDREKELDRAVIRGSELLQGMASNQCLYYSTGWWTYSFCYNAQVTQFHALPPGTNGRVWPPQEDPTVPSFVLGRFEGQKNKKTAEHTSSEQAVSTEVQTQAETNYLVQRLEGGTPCDLTGNNRKIEIQFHCNPQLTDRIGWIKETATCAYLMIVYTPRLCNDVAFQPPKESRAHSITCTEIISEGEVESWEARGEELSPSQTLEPGESQRIVLGNVEIGAKKYIGHEGKKLERGRIVLTQDEKADILIMQKNGQVSSLSAADMKKLDISPEEVESFRIELQKMAGTKDWKIERLDDVNGHIQLRGVVASDDEEEGEGEAKTPEDAKSAETNEDEGAEVAGSQEEYKGEL
ncbi:hypothetical protein PV08_01444 [Exophiala spinifera]|uniref:Endoplasmic reticulum lectin n=1 Tax=Exophiala spinifera TaxID=91928 RepID=A0A0D1YZX0_9EURO|nr:uncharacterized protein PV08_01444 [Exophiala spinifera]KIW20866.1 hypothetical protein PV08_01444 [Exophiala spinifera]